ncbi:MAG: iron-sulfur cluster repair protein YtfE [Myxococcales bacterium]|nr:iron-sulfur cluster repair protein YtfE [Myxococcales bacterium]
MSQLAINVPAASRVFKRHKLDFCCSGQRALSEVCRERGLDPKTVLAELEREAMKVTEPPVAYSSPDELIDHILERYHEPLRQELPELVAMAKRVEIRHGDKPSCPRGLAEHLVALHGDVLEHLAKEEQILFPSIRAGMVVRGPIAVMQLEHEDHGAALERTRTITADLTPPPGACATWRALYLRLQELESELMDHIHLENNVLFPTALRGS